MLFPSDNETTMKASYKYPRRAKLQPVHRPPPPPPFQVTEYIPKHNETLASVEKKIPFDLFIGYKDVIRQAPFKTFKIDNNTAAKEDLDHLNRSRVVMAPPAVFIDDITDTKTKQIVIADMYMTSSANKDNPPTITALKAPRPEKFWSTNTVKLPPLRPPLVPKEWRWESIKWDRQQPRFFVDSNREYWKDIQNLHKCPPCQQSAKIETLKRSGRRF